VGYRLDPQKPVAHEVRRIAGHQFELAIEALTGIGNTESDTAVHAARRRIKKVRALIRLIRPALGRRGRAVNRRLRAVNRLLAPIADGQASLATLTQVAERYGHELPPEVTALIRVSLLRRKSLAEEEAALKDVHPTAAALLRAERDGVKDWVLSESGFDAVTPGVKRTARAARRAMVHAMASSRSERYHTWRQRVKDQWLQVRLLQERCGNGLALDERRLEELDGCLGDCHNCAVLGDVLASDATLNGDDAARLLSLVRRYERELRRRACRLGTTVHHDTPKRFVSRMRRLWRLARRTRRSPQRGTSWRPAA
jgi:CHAD domain-containing protein